MTLLDSTLAYFFRSFKLRHKELPADQAIKAAVEMKVFFAVELYFKGSPIRLIVAASQIPPDLQQLAGSRASPAPALTGSTVEP